MQIYVEYRYHFYVYTYIYNYIYIFLSQVDDFKYNVLHITALSYSIGSFCYSSCHKIYNGVTCQSPRCKRVQWIVSIGSAGMSCRSWNM